MINLKNYQLNKKLHESSNSIVYKALEKETGEKFIVKFANPDNSEAIPSILGMYEKEYEIINYLKLPSVSNLVKKLQSDKEFVLIFKDLGEVSLDHYIKSNTFLIPEFLLLAIQLVKTLSLIHAKNVIHKDINPSNILYDPLTKKATIIDFGISTFFNRESTELTANKTIEGTIFYMSPEQTGRMNRTLDYRTDYYSLGVTFYELLSKTLPFYSKDPFEIIHSHIARTPNSLHEMNPNVPKMLSNIIAKLMAKNPEDRYKSGYGILYDLERSLKEIQENSQINHFYLGKKDFSDKLQIPEKLYGRENDIQNLFHTYENVLKGNVELVLISGYSGLGKSVLVQELYKLISQESIKIISGKFDPYNQNVPFFGISKAIGKFIQKIMTSDNKIYELKDAILREIGENSHVLYNLIPEIK
ncbi:MAG: protein kinase, partial [Leptospiraceae bacterium]|nr:protein kinase [Leptospiraceae bacterium]